MENSRQATCLIDKRERKSVLTEFNLSGVTGCVAFVTKCLVVWIVVYGKFCKVSTFKFCLWLWDFPIVCQNKHRLRRDMCLRRPKPTRKFIAEKQFLERKEDGGICTGTYVASIPRNGAWSVLTRLFEIVMKGKNWKQLLGVPLKTCLVLRRQRTQALA